MALFALRRKFELRVCKKNENFVITIFFVFVILFAHEDAKFF